MRFIHLFVVATLVAAAVDVYKIKFEATVQAERVARLRAEIRRERDTIAALRAEWAQLDNPARIQALAQRHLPLKPLEPTQIESLDRVPERTLAPSAPAPPSDAIANAIDRLVGAASTDVSTGTVSTGAVSTGAVANGPVGTGPVETVPIEIAPVETAPLGPTVDGP
jgi:cell division protein FtsL